MLCSKNSSVFLRKPSQLVLLTVRINILWQLFFELLPQSTSLTLTNNSSTDTFAKARVVGQN